MTHPEPEVQGRRQSLLEHLEEVVMRDPHLLRMREWCSTEPCGTVMCIGGHTCALFDLPQLSWDDARDCLGLTEGEADRLFMPPGWQTKGNPEMSPQSVLATVRRWVATGEIAWGECA